MTQEATIVMPAARLDLPQSIRAGSVVQPHLFLRNPVPFPGGPVASRLLAQGATELARFYHDSLLPFPLETVATAVFTWPAGLQGQFDLSLVMEYAGVASTVDLQTVNASESRIVGAEEDITALQDVFRETNRQIGNLGATLNTAQAQTVLQGEQIDQLRERIRGTEGATSDQAAALDLVQQLLEQTRSDVAALGGRIEILEDRLNEILRRLPPVWRFFDD